MGMLSLTAMPAARAHETGTKVPDIGSKRVPLNLENADIKYALKLLFQSVGADYTLDPNVQGPVTVSLTDVPFKVALESVLRTTQSTAPVTYRVESGIYNIALKVQEPDVTKPGGE